MSPYHHVPMYRMSEEDMRDEGPIPPALPVAPRTPWILTNTSRLADHWKQLMVDVSVAFPIRSGIIARDDRCLRFS